MPISQNPDEFRSDVTQSQHAQNKHESYEVNRPFSAISKTLKKKSEECLHYSFDRTFSYRMGMTTGANISHITYVPTFKTSGDKAELHVQMDITGDATVLGNPPKGGMYVMIADLARKSENTTQIELYYSSYKAAILPTTIKNWIDGKTEGCPDLKEDMASGA